MRPCLMLLALLLLWQVGSVTGSPLSTEDACSTALRNQDATRANLRVDSFEASLAGAFERHTESIRAEISRVSTESARNLASANAESARNLERATETLSAEISRVSTESARNLERATETLRAQITNVSAETARGFAQLKASFDSWFEGPAMKLVYLIFAVFAFTVANMVRNPHKYAGVWAILTGAQVVVQPPEAAAAAAAAAAAHPAQPAAALAEAVFFPAHGHEA
jgi:hypothetical protein